MSLAGTRCTLTDHRCWTNLQGRTHTHYCSCTSQRHKQHKTLHPSPMPYHCRMDHMMSGLQPPDMYLLHTHCNSKRPCCLLPTSTCQEDSCCSLSHQLHLWLMSMSLQSSCYNWIRYARLMHCSICLLGRAHTMSFRDQNICLLRIRYTSCQVLYSPSLRDTPRIPAIQPLQILPCPHRTECTLCSR